MKDAAQTFHWLVSILRARDVPFVVAGGLAARAYGCDRPLNDIDVDIPTADFPKILDDIRPYLTYGPAHFVDDHWDLPLAMLDHDGQIVDLSGGDDIRIFDHNRKIWVSSPDDFSNTVPREIFGLIVPVIPPEQLMAYKSMLLGEHQRVDIEAVEAFLRSVKQGVS